MEHFTLTIDGILQTGATTLSIIALTIMTLSIKFLYVILSITETRHSSTAIMASVTMLSVVAPPAILPNSRLA